MLEKILGQLLDRALEPVLKLLKQQAKAQAATDAKVEKILRCLEGEKSAPMKLIQIKEACLRLGVNMAKLDEIIAAGDITQVITPGGRRKVVESSVDEFIRTLAAKEDVA